MYYENETQELGMKGLEMKRLGIKGLGMKGTNIMGIQKLKGRFNLNKFLKVLSVVSSFTAVLATTSCMGGFGAFGNNNQASTQNLGIQTYTVVRGNIFQEVTATGSVDAKNQNTYAYSVSGKVISALEKGDEFKKGDILVELDNSDGLDKIDTLESDLLTVEDDIAISKGSLNTARINYQKALDSNHIAIQLADLNTQKSEENIKSAFASLESANISADLAYESAASALEKATAQAIQNASSTNPINDAQNKLDSTQAQGDSSQTQAETNYEKAQLDASSTYWNNLSSLESAEAQIKLTKQNISDADLKLKQAERKVQTAKDNIETARKDLEDYKIYAPYDGIVMSSAYKTGEQAGQGGSGISTINSEYLLRSSIGENDIPKIKIGNEAVISLDAYSNTELSGAVEKIIPISTVSSGIVSYDVLLKFTDTKDAQIFYGLSANISIITAKAENVLYVPIQSVYTENGKKYVDVMVTPQGTGNNANGQTPASQPQIDRNQAKNTGNQTQNINKFEVTTGINDYVNIEIKSGIKEGDIIVTSKVDTSSAGN
jgi:HlyD family secretion protein